MSEIIDGPLRNAIRETRENLARTVHDLDPRKRKASEALIEMRDTLEETPVTQLPKTLEVKTTGGDYVSIRTIDGSQMQIEVIPPESLNDCGGIRVSLPDQMIPEGGHVILVTPSSFGAVPRSEELVHYIENQFPNGREMAEQLQSGELPEISPGWRGDLLAHVLSSGRIFNPDEWDFAVHPREGKTIEMFVKINGKTLTPGNIPRGSVPSSPAVVTVLEEVKPGKNGDIVLHGQNDLWSRQEPEALKILFQKLARLYILVEGSAGKERKREDRSIKKLVPQPTAVTY